MLSEIEILSITVLFIAISGFIIVYIAYKDYGNDPWMNDYNKFVDLEKEIEEIELEVYANKSKAGLTPDEEFEETTKRG